MNNDKFAAYIFAGEMRSLIAFARDGSLTPERFLEKSTEALRDLHAVEPEIFHRPDTPCDVCPDNAREVDCRES